MTQPLRVVLADDTTGRWGERHCRWLAKIDLGQPGGASDAGGLPTRRSSDQSWSERSGRRRLPGWYPDQSRRASAPAAIGTAERERSLSRSKPSRSSCLSSLEIGRINGAFRSSHARPLSHPPRNQHKPITFADLMNAIVALAAPRDLQQCAARVPGHAERGGAQRCAEYAFLERGLWNQSPPPRAVGCQHLREDLGRGCAALPTAGARGACARP